MSTSDYPLNMLLQACHIQVGILREQQKSEDPSIIKKVTLKQKTIATEYRKLIKIESSTATVSISIKFKNALDPTLDELSGGNFGRIDTPL